MAHPNGSGGNTTNGTTDFTLKEEPVENLRRLKVRVVGAGFSGICAAIRWATCSRSQSQSAHV